jgi:hypothetical protein
VFGTIVVVVNIKVLISSYQYTVFNVALTMLGIVSFFVVFGLLSTMVGYELTGDFIHLYSSPETYLVLFFFAFAYILIDSGLQQANVEITSWMLKQKEINKKRAKLAAFKDATVTRSKVTSYKSKISIRLSL